MENFKDLAIGMILLIVLASFANVAAASANITGLTRVVLGFILPLAAVGLLFVAFRTAKK